jgi:hypothetical protein
MSQRSVLGTLEPEECRFKLSYRILFFVTSLRSEGRIERILSAGVYDELFSLLAETI